MSLKCSAQLGALVAFVVLVVLLVALGARPGGRCGIGAEPSDAAAKTIPAELMALYQQAEADYGVPWSLLAAINSVESDFGKNVGPSSAGAQGPMQFMPDTWKEFMVDGNHDGRKDVMDPADAIPGAAKLLKKSGAPDDLRKAVFAYNHADWYVDKVLALARVFAEGGAIVAGEQCSGDTGDGSAAAVYAAANELHAMRVPYNYGGGHLTPARPGPGSDGPFNGLDCSSSVSWVLQHAGIKVATMTSGAFMSWGEPGPGHAVTLYTNPGHIIMSIIVGGKRRFFGTSGFGHPAQGTGPAWFTQPLTARYLATFVQRHPPGL